MKVKFGKGPVPPRRYGNNKTTYPWATMQPGQFFEIIGPDKRAIQAKLIGAARRWALRNGGEFASRQTDKGAAVWKIK